MRKARLLRAVRWRLRKPERWVKGLLAVDARSVSVGVTDPVAVAWCLAGATSAARPVRRRYHTWSPTDWVEYVALDGCIKRRGYPSTERFNDAPETTHADVLAVLGEAIAEYEGR